jgi:hypothetical protein
MSAADDAALHRVQGRGVPATVHASVEERPSSPACHAGYFAGSNPVGRATRAEVEWQTRCLVSSHGQGSSPCARASSLPLRTEVQRRLVSGGLGFDSRRRPQGPSASGQAACLVCRKPGFESRRVLQTVSTVAVWLRLDGKSAWL